MIPPEEKCEVQDLNSEHSYFTLLPNVLFDILDPYEFKAYAVLKMTAGEKGACFKSKDTLCQEIGCGKTKLIEIKESLQKKGLIKIKKRIHESGGNAPDLITLVDIWNFNMKKMSEKYANKGGGSPNGPGGVRQTDQGGSPNGPKQDVKEEDVKTTTAAELPAAVFEFENL